METQVFPQPEPESPSARNMGRELLTRRPPASTAEELADVLASAGLEIGRDVSPDILQMPGPEPEPLRDPTTRIPRGNAIEESETVQGLLSFPGRAVDAVLEGVGIAGSIRETLTRAEVGIEMASEVALGRTYPLSEQVEDRKRERELVKRLRQSKETRQAKRALNALLEVPALATAVQESVAAAADILQPEPARSTCPCDRYAWRDSRGYLCGGRSAESRPGGRIPGIDF